MANTFTPTILDTFDAQQVWATSGFAIPDISDYMESMSILHRSKFVVKMTGFESTKHIAGATTGNNLLVNINLTLVGSLPRWLMQALRRLAEGCNGAGMELIFRDDWWTNYQYWCHWTNAGDFSENTELLCGGTMQLESWKWSAI